MNIQKRFMKLRFINWVRVDFDSLLAGIKCFDDSLLVFKSYEAASLSPPEFVVAKYTIRC